MNYHDNDDAGDLSAASAAGYMCDECVTQRERGY